MLFFFHLFIGLTLGALIGRWIDDSRAVPWCTFGAVLPDLIDKPLGHILWHSTVDDGRLLFHGLFVLMLLTAAAVLLWRKGYPQAAFLAAGVATHQIADAMWTTPVVWFFPFLGPYPFNPHPDYLLTAFASEFGTASEWLFCAVLVILLVGRFRGGMTRALGSFVPPLLIAGGFLMIIRGIAGLAETTEIITGITAIIGGAAFLVLFHGNRAPDPEKN